MMMLDDLVAFDVAVHMRDESAIDLQRIHRELLQAAERRISGAEIIHAQANSQSLEFGEHRSRFLRIAHGDGFGDLQLQIVGIEPGLLQGSLRSLSPGWDARTPSR